MPIQPFIIIKTVFSLMLKRIALVSLFVVASASLSVAGENLDALPGKVAAVKEKGGKPDSGMLSMVAHNLGVITERLKEAQEAHGDSIGASGILEGLDVMATAFDFYVGHQDIAAHGSYFRRVQTFVQTLPGGTYDVEVFAGALGQLLDAIVTGAPSEGAFDAFFAYVLNIDSVTLPEGVLVAGEDEEEEVFEEEDGDDGFAELTQGVGVLTLTVQPNNNSTTEEYEDPFTDDDDGSLVPVTAFFGLTSR